MPKVLMGEEMRRAEREKKEDREFQAKLGAYLRITGRNITDLAVIVGVCPATMYSRVEAPGTFRLSEYRRVMWELDKAMQ